jgi:hypothetical protein
MTSFWYPEKQILIEPVLLNGFKLLKVKQLTDLIYYYHNQVVHIQLVKAYLVG